jgi:NAD(P)-dependent dehydrogenase (short-subunit alcohol dehydrogenase family)
MGRIDEKVALITGAARGQGRSHAITPARERASVRAFDCPSGTDAIPYPLGTPEDLAETIAQVEALDCRVVAHEGDVRNQADLDAAVAAGLHQFGQIDVCVAKAGVWSLNEASKAATGSRTTPPPSTSCSG